MTEQRRKAARPDMRTKGIAGHQETYLQEFLDREVEMDSVFARTVRIADELLSRVEREMHRGMQYKANQDPTTSNFDPIVAKSAEGTGKLVAQLQGIHLRLLKEGERQAKNMSREEKIAMALKFVKGLPALERGHFKRDMGWD